MVRTEQQLTEAERITYRGCCPACSNWQLSVPFCLSRGPILNCVSCGLFIALDRSETSQHDTLFHSSIDECRYIEYFESFRKRQYRYVLNRLDLPSGRKLLDVGASYGWLTQIGMDIGLDSYGIEPSHMEYQGMLRDRIQTCSLEQYAESTGRKYDVVTLWHVLEHLKEPVTSVRLLAKLIKDEGVIVVAIPSAEGRMFKLGFILAKKLGYIRLMEELFYTHNPNMHRSYFTPESLEHVFAQADLHISEQYCLDAFDWPKIWRRATNPIAKVALRIMGPVIEWLQFTRNENLIMIVKKGHRLVSYQGKQSPSTGE